MDWQINKEDEEAILNSQDPDELFQIFASKIEELENATIIFLSVMGSRRYNLETKDSDYDMVAVVLYPLLDVLTSLQPPLTKKSPDSTRPDYTIHSVEHYLELLLSGDGKSLELLFIKPSRIKMIDPLWNRLSELKFDLISKSHIQSYIDEVSGIRGLKKLTKLVKDAPDKSFKCASILLRSLQLADKFMDWPTLRCDDQPPNNENELSFAISTSSKNKSFNPTWWSTESLEREFLMNIRNGIGYQATDLVPLVERNLELVKSKLAMSTLADAPSSELRKKVSNWLFSAHATHVPRLNSLHIKAPVTINSSLEPLKDFVKNFIFSLPGIFLFGCLIDENHYFGIYALDVRIKISIESKEDYKVIEAENDDIKITIFELSRFLDAIERSEISYIIPTMWETEQKPFFEIPEWTLLRQDAINIFDYRVLYTALGYVSGRLKSVVSKLDKNNHEIWKTLQNRFVKQKFKFALDLLSTSLSTSASRLDIQYVIPISSLNGKLNAIMEALYEAGSPNPENIQDLKDFIAQFVRLREPLSKLLSEKLDIKKMQEWHWNCCFYGQE